MTGPIDRRLEENGRALFDAYREVEKAVRDERHITSADELAAADNKAVKFLEEPR